MDTGKIMQVPLPGYSTGAVRRGRSERAVRSWPLTGLYCPLFLVLLMQLGEAESLHHPHPIPVLMAHISNEGTLCISR